jgi:putative membrane protein
MNIRVGSLRFAWMAALALAGTSACSVAAGDGVLVAADEDSSEEAVESTSQAFSLTMPQLAAVLAAFNATEISDAQLARTHAADPHVLEFVNELFDYHTAASQQLSLGLAQLDMVPVDNEISQGLIQQGAADRQVLEGLTGPNFDWSFVNAQIYRHRDFLAQLQEQIALVGPELHPGLSHLVPELRSATSRHLSFAMSLLGLIGRPYVPENSFPPGSPVYGNYGGYGTYGGYGNYGIPGSYGSYGPSSSPVYFGPNGPYSPAYSPYYGAYGRTGPSGVGTPGLYPYP